MRLRSVALALQDDKDNGANHGDEVQRQIQQVANDGIRRELGERLLDQLAQPLNVVSSRLDLPALLDQVLAILRQESAIEGIDQSLVNEEGARDQVGDGRAL